MATVWPELLDMLGDPPTFQPRPSWTEDDEPILRLGVSGPVISSIYGGIVASPRAIQPIRAFQNAQRQIYGEWEDLIDRGDTKEAIRQLIEWMSFNSNVLHSAMQGKINATSKVTLRANQATTTVKDPRIGFNSILLLTPTTAAAMAEVSAGTGPYQDYPNTTKQQAVLNHANSATGDRTFAFAIIG